MNMTGPGFYEAHNWMCYLRDKKLIDFEAYNHIHKLLYSAARSNEEKKGIEIAEVLASKHPQAFNQYITKNTDTRITTDYIQITL